MAYVDILGKRLYCLLKIRSDVSAEQFCYSKAISVRRPPGGCPSRGSLDCSAQPD